jgi:hypothetical protein
MLHLLVIDLVTLDTISTMKDKSRHFVEYRSARCHVIHDRDVCKSVHSCSIRFWDGVLPELTSRVVLYDGNAVEAEELQENVLLWLGSLGTPSSRWRTCHAAGYWMRVIGRAIEEIVRFTGPVRICGTDESRPIYGSTILRVLDSMRKSYRLWPPLAWAQ